MWTRGATTAVLALITALAGCTTTRHLTPWLRISETKTWTGGFMAESGGANVFDYDFDVERRIDGEWVSIEDELGSGAIAGFGFAGGTRAVIRTTLLREVGTSTRVPCAGDLRGTPDGDRLLCVEAPAQREEPDVVRLRAFDADARVLTDRALAPPIPRPTATWSYVNLTFLGFLPDGLLFSTYQVDDGQPDRCTGFLLRRDGRWQRLMRFVIRGEIWKCNFPGPWRAELGLPVVPGRRPQDAHGEPDL